MIRHLMRSISTNNIATTWCGDRVAVTGPTDERMTTPSHASCRECLHAGLAAAQATADSMARRLAELRDRDKDDLPTSHGERRGSS